MWFDPLTLVVLGANVLGAAMAIPQAVKILQDRHVGGISPTWAGISIIVNAWWATYGIGVRDWGIVPVSSISVMAYLMIIIALVRFDGRPWWAILRPAAGAAAVTGLIPLVVVLSEGWPTAGIVLGALYGVQLSPAVVAVYRAIDVSGVAPVTWIFALVEAALWGVYGLARVDTGLIALGATGLIMSSLVLVGLLVRPSRADRRSIELRLAPA